MPNNLTDKENDDLLNSILEIGGYKLLEDFNLALEEGEAKGYLYTFDTFLKQAQTHVKQLCKGSDTSPASQYYEKHASIVRKLINKMLTGKE